MLKHTRYFLCLCALGGLMMAGCSKPDQGTSASGTGSEAHAHSDQHDHDHDSHDHEHPESLKEGFQKLSDMYQVIKAAFEKNDPDAAHGELHEIGHLLEEDLPALLQSDGQLSAEAKEKLKATFTKLFDAFFKLDDQLHGGPAANFAEVDKVIAEGLEDYKGLVP